MRNFIEILGIVLPVLIIALAISRLFVKRPIAVNGFTIFFALLLFVIGLLQYYVFSDGGGKSEPGTKLPPLPVSKHSPAFNTSVENVLNAYLRMTDGFVTADTPLIRQAGVELRTALDSLRLDELKVDTLIYETALQPYGNTKAEIESIIADPSIAEKRASFNIFSNELYALLRTVRYDLAKVYWMECPHAFGEDRPGNWLSRSDQLMNPYGREDCTERRSTIDFTQKDTTAEINSTKE